MAIERHLEWFVATARGARECLEAKNERVEQETFPSVQTELSRVSREDARAKIINYSAHSGSIGRISELSVSVDFGKTRSAWCHATGSARVRS